MQRRTEGSQLKKVRYSFCSLSLKMYQLREQIESCSDFQEDSSVKFRLGGLSESLISRLSWLFPTERLPHTVPGTGVGQPQSGSGYQKPTAPPAGEEVDGTGKAGKMRRRWKQLLSSTVLIPFCFFSLQKDKNVKLDESLTKFQQENEHLKARMDRHAALSR